MNTSNKQDQSVKIANEAVEKAYHAVIKQVKDLLANFPTEPLRTYVERTGTNNNSHSFYSPLVYISVAEYYGKRMISFAKNPRVKPHIGPYLDSLIPRIIYKLTSVEVTKHSIEDRLEEYTYHYSKYDDALKHSETLDNYKKDTVHSNQAA
ncbi:hypothetical protein LLH06_16675 [Mucilaginibacter daejeonensis]|uniref:hypothetical protein n=1 Tax=Mucilaginibacter daejeonensis TaxID=398049 RepID=UPI001D1767DE|nr:hypothetical protein [Mucilaginibacter daejeonensis]UEG52591.1 hypothetical protein LLH06_16675 [Mucilaginibacter daejeonensis]